MPDVVAGIQSFAATFQSESDKMLAILTASGDAPPSPAQQQDLDAAMASLLTGLGTQIQLLQAKSAAAGTLSDAITAPNGSFVAGESAVQSAISSTNANLSGLEADSQFPGGDTQAIGMGIVADQGIINWLQGLQSTLQGIVQANTAMGTALSQTLIVWQTLVGKYQYVADQVKQGGSSGVLGPGDIKSAQLGWTQIEDLAKGLA